jgi:hypothetical protein
MPTNGCNNPGAIVIFLRGASAGARLLRSPSDQDVASSSSTPPRCTSVSLPALAPTTPLTPHLRATLPRKRCRGHQSMLPYLRWLGRDASEDLAMSGGGEAWFAQSLMSLCRSPVHQIFFLPHQFQYLWQYGHIFPPGSKFLINSMYHHIFPPSETETHNIYFLLPPVTILEKEIRSNK